jgi:hypothetical protein
MMCSLVAAFAVGVMLGLQFRVPGVLCVSSFVVFACMGAVVWLGAPSLGASIFAVAMVCALQGGYYIGLIFFVSAQSWLHRRSADEWSGDPQQDC